MAGRAQDFSSLQVWWDHAPSLPPGQLKQGHPWPHVAQPLSWGALEMRDMGPWEQQWGWG